MAFFSRQRVERQRRSDSAMFRCSRTGAAYSLAIRAYLETPCTPLGLARDKMRTTFFSDVSYSSKLSALCPANACTSSSLNSHQIWGNAPTALPFDCRIGIARATEAGAALAAFQRTTGTDAQLSFRELSRRISEKMRSRATILS